MTTVTSDDQLERLPAYARNEIRYLRAAVQRLLLELDSARGLILDGPLEVAPYRAMGSGGRSPIRYADPHVRFHLGGQEWIDVRLENGRLDVHGSDRFMLAPGASNSVTVIPYERQRATR